MEAAPLEKVSVLKAIQDFFRSEIDQDSAQHDDHSLHLATASLLFEVMRADFHVDDPAEREMLQQTLQQTFALSATETTQLAQLAEKEVEDAVSLHQFTGLINKNFMSNEKVRVVEMLWQVAYADGRLDRYEEGLIRKIADLLYVPHRDFIRARHKVEDTCSRGE